jgi:hypothetical protein
MTSHFVQDLVKMDTGSTVAIAVAAAIVVSIGLLYAHPDPFCHRALPPLPWHASGTLELCESCERVQL